MYPYSFIQIIGPYSARTYITHQYHNSFQLHNNTSKKCIFFSFKKRFSLGPLELRVMKNVNGNVKTAKAVTDIMLGLMDMRIKRGQAEITDVYFDEPGGVSVSGNLRRAQFKKSSPQTYDNDRPYR